MPKRDVFFSKNSFYHIYNRGVAKQPIFTSTKEHEQFILTLNYYRYSKPPIKLSRLKKLNFTNKSTLLNNLSGANKKHVNIICFCLMPNHFHLLLEQLTDNGISVFAAKTLNSYTRYFNTIHNRIGPIFQGQFKAVQIESNNQLLHISRYIHLNPLVSNLTTSAKLIDYPWSSYKDFVTKNSNLCTTKIILDQFKTTMYSDFVLNHSDYARELEIIKHQTLDLD